MNFAGISEAEDNIEVAPVTMTAWNTGTFRTVWSSDFGRTRRGPLNLSSKSDSDFTESSSLVYLH